MSPATHASTKAVALQICVLSKHDRLDASAHARCIDEFFRVMIDLASAASTGGVNAKLVSLDGGS